MRHAPASAARTKFVDGAELEYTTGTHAELQVRAGRVGRLTHKQFNTIRQLAVDAGLAPQVAAVTAWVAANPQDAINQLKQPRVDVIAPGVTARVIDVDVLTAPLIRAPENLRMGGMRYEGDYRMPTYTSGHENSALVLRLDGSTDVDTAMRFYFAELAKIDNEIAANNKHGEDIRDNGVRVGGILFPLVIEFAGRSPGVAGWETADGYGRTYFTQDAEGVEPVDVLGWLRDVPADGHELAQHPLSKRRSELLSIADKVLGGSKVSRGETKKLRWAVMPKTRLVLSVDGDAPLDEVRRRVVSLQHLNGPTPFSEATGWQTRAEAVLTRLEQKGEFVVPKGWTSHAVRRWLARPGDAARNDGLNGDDIAMIAVASMLTKPKAPRDKHITEPLKGQGLTGNELTTARTEVVAHVVCGALSGRRDVDGPRSAMARVLRWKALREQGVDPRPVHDLLMDALKDWEEASRVRAAGGAPVEGAATLQLATRAAFHLICTPFGTELLLPTSLRGDEPEPDRVLELLTTTPAGLHQLAQAIFDGRRGLAVRRVPPSGAAEDLPAPPSPEDRLDAVALRALASSRNPVIADVSAAARVAGDSRELRAVLEHARTVVRRMGTRADSAVPLVEDRGWNDPHGCLPLLHELIDITGHWRQVNLVVTRQHPTARRAEGRGAVG